MYQLIFRGGHPAGHDRHNLGSALVRIDLVVAMVQS